MVADMMRSMSRPKLSALGFSILLCATSAVAQTVPSQAQMTPAQIVAQNRIEDAKFASFVKDFRDPALTAGISPETYARAKCRHLARDL